MGMGAEWAHSAPSRRAPTTVSALDFVLTPDRPHRRLFLFHPRWLLVRRSLKEINSRLSLTMRLSKPEARSTKHKDEVFQKVQAEVEVSSEVQRLKSEA